MAHVGSIPTAAMDWITTECRWENQMHDCHLECSGCLYSVWRPYWSNAQWGCMRIDTVINIWKQRSTQAKRELLHWGIRAGVCCHHWGTLHSSWNTTQGVAHDCQDISEESFPPQSNRLRIPYVLAQLEHLPPSRRLSSCIGCSWPMLESQQKRWCSGKEGGFCSRWQSLWKAGLDWWTARQDIIEAKKKHRLYHDVEVLLARTITDVTPFERRNGNVCVSYSGVVALRREQCYGTAESWKSFTEVVHFYAVHAEAM